MRTVVVTGANRGIGLEVARALVAAGWRVVLVARDPEAGRAAARALGAAGDARFVQGDLSSVRSIRLAARSVLDACDGIDVLVHNAGVWPSRRELDDDGLERAFVVNHLAPFALTRLLEPALRRGGRVVQVSAGLYVKGRVDVERTPRGADFHAIRTYATTKLCNLLLLSRSAERLAERGVSINAVHPGVVRTSLGDRPGAFGLLIRGVKRLWASAEAGAAPVVRLVLAPELEGMTGRYFHIEAEAPLAAPARDARLARALWAQAETLTGCAS